MTEPESLVPSSEPALLALARNRFRAAFGRDADGIALAPGRVNLIGEHTDYNDGFVLPMAIDRHVALAFARREDGRLVAEDARAERREATLAALAPPGAPGWFSYLAGVAWALAKERGPIPGIDALVIGNVPQGAGLASSAALEMAAARALSAAAGLTWDAVAMARLGRRAENEYVGVACGIMDQFASALCREGAALLLDCRSLRFESVPLPAAAAVALLDTGLRRKLSHSAYNARRAACEAAVRALSALRPGLAALRDVDGELLEAGRDRLDVETYRRARHVVAETARPAAMARALRAGDLAAAGALMNDSHESLRELYEVSSPELDRITERARAHPACFGARLTGAGFGGFAVALIEGAGAAAFAQYVEAGRGGPAGAVWVCRPGAGARLVI